MKWAIISDIHSNFDALNSMIERLDDCEMVINAGDTVGYGPEPEKCINAVKNNNKIKSVLGNHDYSVLTLNTAGLNDLAVQAVMHNSKNISDESRKFLKSLPENMKVDINGFKVFVCHGSPLSINQYVYEDTPAETLNLWLEKTNCNAIIMGHTHRVFVKKLKNGWILNPGSVGQPRDGNPKSSCLIADFGKNDLKIEVKRIPYNIESVNKKIKNEKLPEFLADRLYDGL